MFVTAASPRTIDSLVVHSDKTVLQTTLSHEILSLHNDKNRAELLNLFKQDEKAFVAALKEIEEMPSEDTIDLSGSGAGSSAEGVSPKASAKDYKLIANEIIQDLNIDAFSKRNVEALKASDLEWVVYTNAAKKTLENDRIETETRRAHTEAMWNENAKDVLTSPFNLFRTVVAIATMTSNLFASMTYAVGSISCFADVEVKALRRETAKNFLSYINHDAINALYGLVQAIPLFGTFITKMLSNRRYAYEYDITFHNSLKTQTETWTEFEDKLIKAENKNNRIELVKIEEAEEIDDDAISHVTSGSQAERSV